ncbi:MAG: antibiotic acetyltransferase [Acidobacteriota bacterium]|nr:antibiotic acetyltransferase [Acidobacteriota bacterium]
MKDELRRCAASALLRKAYEVPALRRAAVAMALRAEGGEFYSATVREILACHHRVQVGAYSYGPCMAPGEMPPGVSVGRYVSMSAGVRVFRRNHPLGRLSLHPFFYNHELGFVARDTVEGEPLTIGHDAWIGYGAILLPGCRRVGNGAAIGAGAVVTHDVPDFAVAVGNPARVLRYRFSPEMRECIAGSRWWECTAMECAGCLKDFLISFDEAVQWRQPETPSRQAAAQSVAL